MRFTFIVNRCNSVYACHLSFLKYNDLWVQSLHFCRFLTTAASFGLKAPKGFPGIWDMKVKSWQQKN